MFIPKTLEKMFGKESVLFREISEGTYRKVFHHLQDLRQENPGIREDILLMYALCNLVEHKAATLPPRTDR